jgi:predicted nucleic-acid-binding protein
MKIIADTNVLLRFVIGDDPAQYKLALKEIDRATAVVVTNQTLCELACVLKSRYEVTRTNIAATINLLRETEKIVVDTSAVDAGLSALQAGADFADGVTANEGLWMGGEIFVSFDKKAVATLVKTGHRSRLLA